MDIKWYLRFFENSNDLKFGCGMFFLFLLLGSIGTILYFNSDTYSLKIMGELAAESKSASMSYDFNKAHERLIQLESLSKNSDEGKEIYNEAFDYVFNAEAIFLCAKGDDESINRLVFLLASIPVVGVALPEGFTYNSNVGSVFREHEKYIEYTNRFNQKCDALIDLAIANHNISIAERIIPLFKLTTEPLRGLEKDTADKYVEHKIVYINNAKDNAIRKVNKAIKEGVFPKTTKEIK